MRSRLVQLAWTALALVLATACVDVEQHLHLHRDGRVDLLWRLGLVERIASGPLGQTPEDREHDWTSAVPEPMREWIAPRVETSAGRVWLVLDAHLPSPEHYAAFRTAFVERFEADRDPNPWLYPPNVERRLLEWRVWLDVPADDAVERSASTDAFRWTLRIASDLPVSDHDADRVDAGVLVWDRPLTRVSADGIYATASFARVSATAWVGLSVLALAVVAGALWAGRRSGLIPRAG